MANINIYAKYISHLNINMTSKLARKTPAEIRENLFKEISPGCR